MNAGAHLKTLSIPLRPTASSITPLDTPRDRLPNGRITHRMILTYKLKLSEGGSVTPVLEPLRQAVYDGALEGQVYAVYDVNKQRLSFGDVYPAAVTLPKGGRLLYLCKRVSVLCPCALSFGDVYPAAVTLPKGGRLLYVLPQRRPCSSRCNLPSGGWCSLSSCRCWRRGKSPSETQVGILAAGMSAGEFTIKVALRHDAVDVLSALKDLPLRVDKALSNRVSVPVYRSLAEAVRKGTAAKEFALDAGERCVSASVCLFQLIPVDSS